MLLLHTMVSVEASIYLEEQKKDLASMTCDDIHIVIMDFRASERKELAIDIERGIDSTASKEGSEGSHVSDGSINLLHKKDLNSFIYEKMISEGIVNLPQKFSSCTCGQNVNGESVHNGTLKTDMTIKLDSGIPRTKSYLKSPKPPRPPRSLSMDITDQKLIQEIANLAKLKRARIERKKALNKKRNSKGASGTNLGAMIVTVLFCLVIVWEVLANKFLS